MAPVGESHDYQYDLIVIGGGSGGLAAAKEAAGFGKKVACLDYVHPSPQGSSWGLGGTCVNVGCIPKKLMHQAAILGHGMDDAKSFGWTLPEKKEHNWATMRDNIQDYIGSLNWKYRVALREKQVSYLNKYGELIDAHTVKVTGRNGESSNITSQHILLATGMRPRYPDVPGAKEYAISSDDLFSLAYEPGKILVVGASYVSLECAGFLAAFGYDVTVMVRSILLRGFDQQMSEKIGDFMKNQEGIKFIRPCVPTKIERLKEGEPGLYNVTAKMQDSGEEVIGEYNTVMFAIGRDPCTSTLGLNTVGVNMNRSGYVIVDDADRTNISNIYAIGDIALDKPELTPVAIKAGRLLARRLYGGSQQLMDYVNVPTTVFTPLEYGAIGYSEEAAIEKFGEDNIEVYHTNYWPLEWTVPGKDSNICYAKLVCLKSMDEKVVGFHVVGPNAGEITQGFTVAIKMGATKKQFDDMVGIHPTCAEVFADIQVTKSSGEEVGQAGC